jgi:hypothetical protein
MDGWAYYADRNEEKHNGVESSADYIRRHYGDVQFIRWEQPGTGLWNDAVVRDRTGAIRRLRVTF